MTTTIDKLRDLIGLSTFTSIDQLLSLCDQVDAEIADLKKQLSERNEYACDNVCKWGRLSGFCSICELKGGSNE